MPVLTSLLSILCSQRLCRLSTDNEYYEQLVGNPNPAVDAPIWKQPAGSPQWGRDIAGLMMLNVDIGIARDLDKNITGTSEASCEFPTGSVKSCPLAQTLTKASVYRNDNQAWLVDFKRVIQVMANKGLPPLPPS